MVACGEQTCQEMQYRRTNQFAKGFDPLERLQSEGTHWRNSDFLSYLQSQMRLFVSLTSEHCLVNL